MKTEKEILEKIAEIKLDDRLAYQSATIFGNAPLALIQSSLTTKLHTLEWILGLPLTQVPINNGKPVQKPTSKSKIQK